MNKIDKVIKEIKELSKNIDIIVFINGRAYGNMKCHICKEEIPMTRASLGYKKCIKCAEEFPDKPIFTIAPAYNKGAYQVISKRNVKDIGK